MTKKIDFINDNEQQDATFPANRPMKRHTARSSLRFLKSRKELSVALDFVLTRSIYFATEKIWELIQHFTLTR